MSPAERRVFAGQALVLVLALAAAGLALRAWVARTLGTEHRVHLAFLDLSLRDRARFLGDTLSDQWDRERTWPENLSDVLTRNHADYNRDIFMQVFGMRGDVVAASANTPPDTALAPGARPEQGWKSHDSRDAEGRPIRLVTYPIYTGLGTEAGVTFHGYAQAGLLLPDTARQVARFTGFLALGLTAFGLAVAMVIDIPFDQAIVAFAPGGLDAMMSLALALHMDTAFVAAHQFARFAGIAFGLPFFLRWARGRAPEA